MSKIDTENLQQVLSKIHDDVRPLLGQGKVADYIPALAEVNPNNIGIAVSMLNGESICVGDYDIPFSIQSISKVFTLAMVMSSMDESLWQHVGLEPSGTAFNSLVQLEHECGIPRNPFINAGALVVTDRLISNYENPKEAILSFVRDLCGKDTIYYDEKVAQSERENADRNMALAYLMKSFGNIENDVNELIDVYCHQCSIAMDCKDLSKAFLLFANHGTVPYSGKKILTSSQAKRLGAIMLTCGFYDESGEFAFRAGIPGKSGVGGGIAAYMPENLAITTWSPELNKQGNSIVGMEILERFTTVIKDSIF